MTIFTYDQVTPDQISKLIPELEGNGLAVTQGPSSTSAVTAWDITGRGLVASATYEAGTQTAKVLIIAKHFPASFKSDSSIDGMIKKALGRA